MVRKTNTVYQSTRHAKFSLSYHFIWCPKYRKGILSRPEIVQAVKDSIHEMAKTYGCTVNALEVMPDHVHLSLSAPPRYSPAHLAGKFKGASGSRIAAHFPEVKQRGKVWTNSYFCASLGSVSTELIRRYIESQWRCIE